MTRDYPARPLVGLGVILFRNLPAARAVLLARRVKAPNAGQWSLPGGAQELGETAEQGARRELLEETGLTAGPLHLAAHFDVIHRDNEGCVQFHYTILDFAGMWASGEAQAGSDVSEIAWAPIDALGLYNLTVETHRVIELAVSSAGAMEPHSAG